MMRTPLATLFTLAFGVEAGVPPELVWLTVHVANYCEEDNGVALMTEHNKR